MIRAMVLAGIPRAEARALRAEALLLDSLIRRGQLAPAAARAHIVRLARRLAGALK